MIARIYRVFCDCFSALAAKLTFGRKPNSNSIEFIWEDTQKSKPTSPIRLQASTTFCGKQIRLYVCLSPDYRPLDAKSKASKYEWYFVVKEDMDHASAAFQCGCADTIDEAKDIVEAIAFQWIREQQEQSEV